MTAYYNEHDSKAAATLREVIKEGLIAPGDVDERSIEDVTPAELMGYTQCHFFAGYGIWSYALRLTGWPDNREVWTGSCPCQPFSQAGKGKGFTDERHLWPAWFHLIQHGKRPGIPVYGEQVASPDGLAWLDLVWADMEAANHTVRPFDLCSAGFGAPIIRQRTFWVAGARSDGLHRAQGIEAEVCGIGKNGRAPIGSGSPEWMERASCKRWFQRGPVPTNGWWRNADWLRCRDDKWRPVEPGTFPLAHGYPERVGLLRGAGNAISPFVAAAFIQAHEESLRII